MSACTVRACARVRARQCGRGVALALLLVSGFAVVPVEAQDVEARSWLSGRPLPRAYYDLIARDPTFFELDRGWIARVATASLTGAAVQGRLPLVVVQVLFADSPEPHIASDEIQRILFDGPAPYGTLTEFYREISGGRLTVAGSVLPWVRTAITRAETVGSTFGLGGDAQTGTFLVQALAAADPLVDFGEFDNDGPDGVPNSGDDDGFVDAVAFQFLERAASCGGDGIWPHRSRISGWAAQTGGPYVSADLRPDGQAVLVDGYIVQSTVQCDGSPLTASVIAHELGHVLGLPDLYHAASGILPSQRRWVLGCWTLMAAGSWGCGDGSTFGSAPRPSHMGPWEKSRLGWIQEDVVGSVRDQDFVLDPVQTSGRSLRVPLSTGEYFQIEYRPRIGFDADLPAAGVLIYHIEPARSLYPAPGAPRLYRIALEESDGDSALVKTADEGGNRGVAGDAWATAGTAAFSNITNPSARRNAGLPSTITIHSIRMVDGQAIVRLSTAPAAALVSGAAASLTALSPVDVELRAAGGALPYTWTVLGALPEGVTTIPAGETLRLGGAPLEPGAFPVQLQIRDALGTLTTETITVDVAPVTLPFERVLQPFTQSAATPLSDAERTYLDRAGNRNGRYDVGDLRRYLRSRT